MKIENYILIEHYHSIATLDNFVIYKDNDIENYILVDGYNVIETSETKIEIFEKAKNIFPSSCLIIKSDTEIKDYFIKYQAIENCKILGFSLDGYILGTSLDDSGLSIYVYKPMVISKNYEDSIFHCKYFNKIKNNIDDINHISRVYRIQLYDNIITSPNLDGFDFLFSFNNNLIYKNDEMFIVKIKQKAFLNSYSNDVYYWFKGVENFKSNLFKLGEYDKSNKYNFQYN